MAGHLTVLGFAPASNAAALRAALGAVRGPALTLLIEAGVAAIAQAGQRRLGLLRGRAASMASLGSLQRRLEIACQQGPFLPADPAHAACRAADLPGLLRAAAPDLLAALAARGRLVQWDIVLRWQPDAVLRAQHARLAQAAASKAALAEAVQATLAHDRALRDAALRAALSGLALDMIGAGAGDTQTGLTILVPPDSDAAIEAALNTLPEAAAQGADADLRGPMPPVSFAPVRIAANGAAEIAAAWTRLALPASIDAGALRQGWRATAQRLHPDLGAADSAPMAQAGDAYRLLRGLLPGQGAVSLAALQGMAGPRLLVPQALQQEATP